MSNHAGFDTSIFPGLPVMQHLKSGTNLEWCGFYLTAPSHSTPDWMTHRAGLVAQGWGIAPIYVGQQVIGPGSHIVTASQGKLDGADAVAKMQAAGFPPGRFCFLDLENGPPFSVNQKKYVMEWAKAVHHGGFSVGIYCSFLMAAAVHSAVPGARLWVFHVPTTTTTVVAGTTFPAPSPAGSGVAGAHMWQRAMACIVSVPGGGTLLVDLSTAASPDPSV